MRKLRTWAGQDKTRIERRTGPVREEELTA